MQAQLPHDGGAFYTNDTLDQARPHYKCTWPSILEASAIWLTYGQGMDNEFSNSQEQNPEDINRDRFFLLFGVSMEALSNNRSADMSRDEVQSSLRSLKALLDHPWSRKSILAKDHMLLVELCNVLHRTVLTRDHPGTHLLAMEVLGLALMTSSERMDIVKKQRRKELELPANLDNNDNLPELDLLGDGGDDGELKAGKSVVYATLEVCLCVLVRHYPELSSRATNLKSATAIQAKSKRRITDEQIKLVTMALNALTELPSLCSPLGALTILPSVLWLMTGVLKHQVHIASSLTGLKVLATSPYSHDERSSQKWSMLMQSALLTIVDLTKSEDGLKDEDILLALAVFILNCPAEVVIVNDVKYPSINAFSNCFQMTQPIRVRRRCIQTLTQIFLHPDKRISVPYIQSLLPQIFALFV